MRVKTRLAIFLASGILLGTSASHANSPAPPPWQSPERQAQRDLYQEASQLLAKGQFVEYSQLKAALEDYPLYPYLRFRELRASLKNPRSAGAEPVSSATIAAFEQRYPNLPILSLLQKQWLWHLAKQPDSSQFINEYKPNNDRNLFCLWINKRFARGERDSLAPALIKDWEDKGTPRKNCRPAIDALISSGAISNEWLTMQLRESMYRGASGDVNFLQQRLPAGSAKRAEVWLAVHKDPNDRSKEYAFAAAEGKPLLDDSAYSRLALRHGLYKLARKDPEAAHTYWHLLRKRYRFSTPTREEITARIAQYGVANKHPRAAEWIDALPGTAVTEKQREWRLRLALQTQNWPALARFIHNLPTDVKTAESQWQYWQARALEQTGKAKVAKKLYKAAAKHSNFYGFLAADKVGTPYKIEDNPVTRDSAVLQQLQQAPALQRAYELRLLGEMINARREWFHYSQSLTPKEKAQAAILASDWDWHRQSIGLLGKLKRYDDLQRRYPLPYRDIILNEANRNQIDSPWVYGIMRSESLFQADATSPAKARGLMQLMPATARITARKFGLSLSGNLSLYQPEINIPLGSAYLGQMYARFEQNAAMASAAYNAGPGRVKRWRPKDAAIEADIWVETIPFKETRNYVRRVLTAATLFEWRMSGKPRRISSRLPPITPEPTT